MKNYFVKTLCQLDKLLIIIVIGATVFASCVDDYYYDNKEPNWLGTNIYDSLRTNGHFTNYVKMIDDLGYTDVFKLTGSKTLFVASDSSFTEFYKSNVWGVQNYSQLSLAQKKMLFKFSMINNAYILKTLANYYDGTFHEGIAMRRLSELAVLDTIPSEMGNQLPTSPVWDYFRMKGIRLLKDNTIRPLVYFTKDFLNKYSITDEDVQILTGSSRSGNDVYVFNDKIVYRDITCKNGYVHVLKDVLIPPTNMAQIIQDNASSSIPEDYRTSIFSKLLDRFCVPLFDKTNTTSYTVLHPDFKDSIFVKRYYASLGGLKNLIDVQHNERIGFPAPNLLAFDPGWNAYTASAIQADMAAMFVPTDAAMNNFLNNGVGATMKARFGSWENMPDNIVLALLKRHMRSSLIESVPSKFSRMVDAENYSLPVKKGDIVKSYLGVNGGVYLTSNVYAPKDYISVYSPVLFSENSKIMNWAITCFETSYDKTQFPFYKLYLNSLEVKDYSLMIPTDEYLKNYVDPIAFGQDVQAVLKFRFDSKNNTVVASIWKYNKATGVVGDSIGEISGNQDVSVPNLVRNRLWNLLDSHIVVGAIEGGDKYFVTKANDIVKINGAGTSLNVQGGGDILNGTQSNVSKVFTQANGKTYFLDKPIQPALKSVYRTLYDTPEFSEFFNLLSGAPADSIFANAGTFDSDLKIKFFNAYNYTVYVPSNAAIQKALADKTILSWTDISNLSLKDQAAATHKLIRFLRYHFQDNSVFFGKTYNDPTDQITHSVKYQSATLKDDNIVTFCNSAKNKYFKIGVLGTANSMTLTMDSRLKDDSGNPLPLRTANVLTSDPVTGRSLYNLVVKDYIFAKNPTAYNNITSTGAAGLPAFSTSTITTSASAVIHQIDNVLTFE